MNMDAGIGADEHKRLRNIERFALEIGLKSVKGPVALLARITRREQLIWGRD